MIAVDTETDALDAHRAGLVGVSLAVSTGPGLLHPAGACPGRQGAGRRHRPVRRGRRASDVAEPVPGQIPLDHAIARLKPLLENPGVLKVGQNLKYDWVVLARYGIEIAPFDDTMLISYVLDAGKGGHGMDELARRHLGHQPITFSDVAGTGRNKVSFDRVAIDKATAYAAEDADVTLRLWRMMKPRLVAEHRVAVYETLERPLLPVIARMEQRGIRVDREMLSAALGRLLADPGAPGGGDPGGCRGDASPSARRSRSATSCSARWACRGPRRPPSGQWATPATLLEELAQAGHELPKKILEWRQLSKLKSTYTDSLQTHADRETARVHTSLLAGGDHHRPAVLLRAEPAEHPDPHRGGPAHPPGLRGGARQPADLGGLLADRIAAARPHGRHPGTPEGVRGRASTSTRPRPRRCSACRSKEMTPDLRRRAKTINFGIIYGISAFGLADRLGIGREEASAFIKQYFEQFPGIRDYIDTTKRSCRDKGYVTTLFGRVCHYPQIRSNNPSERASVERQAINAPIQGSAADIIRRAMTRMEPALAARKLDARMLLQVHDELVFEVAEDEVERRSR